MATNTFDNAGSATNLYETADDWSLGHIPEGTDDVVIAVDCTVSTDESAVACASLTINSGITLTVANGADIRFTAASAITGTMTMAATSAVYFTECNVVVTLTTGHIECDGGILNLVSTGTTVTLSVSGSLTGTTNANGNTDVTVSGSANDKFNIILANAAATFSGLSAAKRLGIKMDSGASPSTLRVNTDDGLPTFLHLDGARLGMWVNLYQGVIVSGCDIENGTYGVYVVNVDIIIRDSFLHGCSTHGLRAQNSLAKIYNSYFGQTPALASDPNADDVYVSGTVGLAFNCVFEDETIVGLAALFISTKHDRDAELFKVWQLPNDDIIHTIESEMTIVQAGRQSQKIVTDAQTTSEESRRMDWVLAGWPATHGDTLDVTLYVRGQAGDKIWVVVDPESDYGTTQSDEYTQLVNDAWEQVTVPQYTVNTNAAEQMGIPIVVRAEEASKTWYIDTLAVTQA